MGKTVSVSCPLDCPDLCRFDAHVEAGRIKSLAPDPHHPVTQGFACRKGRQQYKRLTHPERLTHPLIKGENGFEKASYEQVLDLISKKLLAIKQQYGSSAILDYSDTGAYGGLKAMVQTIFFNCFGGAATPSGSLCWGAGLAAQRYDFGTSKGHDPDDLLNSRVILVWGRNPKFTNLHLYGLLKKARKNGTRILVIDPVRTATAKAFEHIPIRPSTDGALALGMAAVIIAEGLFDEPFIRQNVLGFNRFRQYAAGFTPEKVENLTGVSQAVLRDLALSYARADTASIYVGFGMQRYAGGGNAIRSIDALGSITGRIGCRGGGVNYAAKSFGPYLDRLEKNSLQYAVNKRSFPVARLGEFLENAQDPPIKAVFVMSANPLNQSPDLVKTIEQFSRIEFKVVFDHFMTDTARHADIVIPGAFSFEQEDLFVSGMYSPILNHSQKAVDPPGGLMPETEFYLALARKMGLDNLGFDTPEAYLKQGASVLLEKEQVRFSELKDRYLRVTGNEVPWADRVFATPSGKIELFSEKAFDDGLSALPTFEMPVCAGKKLPLRLLTCHAEHSMHSQGFAFTDMIPEVSVCLKTAAVMGLEDGSAVRVRGVKKAIKACLKVDDDIYEGTAFMYQGYWHKSGAVNFLTDSRVSDMGGQAAYYDSFCTLESWE